MRRLLSRRRAVFLKFVLECSAALTGVVLPAWAESREKAAAHVTKTHHAEEPCQRADDPMPADSAKLMKMADDVVKSTKATGRAPTLRSTVKERRFSHVLTDLRSRVGACLLDRERNQPVLDEQQLVYDQTVLAHWKKRDQHARAVLDERGRPIATRDLITIDTLARTLYGEMASCFKHGVGYPMAVTRIAMNRVSFIEKNPKKRKRFAAFKATKQRSDLTQVLTSPYQYSAWNRNAGAKPNSTLKLVLCPPISAEKKYYRNENPPPRELKIWEQAVEVAATAVLRPRSFKERTRGIQELYYTSGLGRFKDGFIKVSRKVDGKPLDRNQCIEIWKEDEVKK